MALSPRNIIVMITPHAKVLFKGEFGAFSHIAATQYFNDQISCVGVNSFREVFMILEDWRKQIDNLDYKILFIILKRMEVVEKIGK